MLVRFTKARHEDRPHTLTCVRVDGTSTGMASTPHFIFHDLTHFAVETELGTRSAFFGLLAAGADIESFTEREPGSRKAKIQPDDAYRVEQIVGVFDLQRAAGLSDTEMEEQLRERFSGESPLSLDVIGKIRGRRDELFRQWAELPPGKSLELRFS